MLGAFRGRVGMRDFGAVAQPSSARLFDMNVFDMMTGVGIREDGVRAGAMVRAEEMPG